MKTTRLFLLAISLTLCGNALAESARGNEIPWKRFRPQPAPATPAKPPAKPWNKTRYEKFVAHVNQMSSRFSSSVKALNAAGDALTDGVARCEIFLEMDQQLSNNRYRGVAMGQQQNCSRRLEEYVSRYNSVEAEVTEMQAVIDELQIMAKVAEKAIEAEAALATAEKGLAVLENGRDALREAKQKIDDLVN